MAFFWAFVFGLLFGVAAYFRVERADLRGDVRWHVTVRQWLERVEWWSYDWRARELGAAAERSDQVVLVTVDDETIANARESERADWAVRPWPRDLAGEVVEQVIKEGASVVLFDQSLADVSAHHCAPCRGDKGKSDDELFAARLERNAGKVVLVYDWSAERPRPGDRALTPVLLKVGEFDNEGSALGAIRQVLAKRTTAYLTVEGEKRALWAGAVSDAKARELAAALELKNPTTRGLVPADDASEVDRAWLVRKLGAVSMQGIDPDRLPVMRGVDAPVPEVLSAGSPPAAATLPPDADGRVRSIPLLVAMPDENGRNQVLATAPLRVMMALSGVKDVRVEGGQLKLGDRFAIPVDPEGFHGLHFDAEEAGRGGRGTLKRVVPAWRLLVNREDDQAGRGIRHHDNDLIGRVVIFTDDRAGVRPTRTPIGSVSRAAVFGQALVDMLHGNGITRVAPNTDFWITVAFAITGAVLAMAWSSLLRRPGWLTWALTLGFVVVLHSLVARQLFVQQQRWVVMAAPVLACSFTFLASLGYARAIEHGLREFVLRALGGAVRADVFQRVERNLLLMRPERRDLTIYFSDIEGFTAVAHDQDPRDVVTTLQRYLSEMTNVVLDRQGHVDKYLGDGLMAFWGAPVDIAEQTALACEAALEIRKQFEVHREEWEKKLGHALTVRAGIDRGQTLVGEMGTFHRVNYTVMGEPVATAFRLESLAKRYGVTVLVGEGVPERAGDQYVFREVDTIRLGRQVKPVRIHELIGRKAALEARREWLLTYEAAIEAYRGKQFLQALELFNALEAKQADSLVARYVKRCEKLVDTPPPEDWDGVYPHQED